MNVRYDALVARSVQIQIQIQIQNILVHDDVTVTLKQNLAFPRTSFPRERFGYTVILLSLTRDTGSHARPWSRDRVGTINYFVVIEESKLWNGTFHVQDDSSSKFNVHATFNSIWLFQIESNQIKPMAYADCRKRTGAALMPRKSLTRRIYKYK
jgi:hypothetical protein